MQNLMGNAWHSRYQYTNTFYQYFQGHNTILSTLLKLYLTVSRAIAMADASIRPWLPVQQFVFSQNPSNSLGVSFVKRPIISPDQFVIFRTKLKEILTKLHVVHEQWRNIVVYGIVYSRICSFNWTIIQIFLPNPLPSLLRLYII